MSVHLLDLYPSSGTFSPNEPIRLMAEVKTEQVVKARFRASLYHLAEFIEGFEFDVDVQTGRSMIPIEWELNSPARCGYGVRVDLIDARGDIGGFTETAFDVLDSWVDSPRYGFLTDFAPDREDVEQVVADLARFHINGLQFYDWQYRHDQLLSPTEIYHDPLGRKLSLDTVRAFIHTARNYGIAAMPYLAVYAASRSFWDHHPSWRLLDENGQALLFENFLGIMDPSPDAPWIEHLMGSCHELLLALDFHGLHIDQYGEPKVGFSVEGEEIDLPSAFRHFIVAAKKRFPEACLTFNAVGNWPIEALASAPLDFNYIEVWRSTPTFEDLRRITRQSRSLSGDRPLVIALYLPAEAEVNIRLTDAILFASGACRIELGENRRLLTDPYFPNHQPIPLGLYQALRRYYDLAVRYGEWMGPWVPEVDGLELDLPEGVWVIERAPEGWLVLHLINFRGLGDPRWDMPLPAPSPMEHFSIKVSNLAQIRGIWWASPDLRQVALREAEWEVEGDQTIIGIPSLEYWTMVAIQTEAME